jgi:hypothetical protein
MSRALAGAVTTLSLVVALTLLAAPVATNAQPTGTVYRIGLLSSVSASRPPVEAFRQGLRELGWVEGQNVVIETIPKIRLVAILWNPANPAQALAIRDVKLAARSVGVQLQLLEARGPSELDDAFATMAKQRVEALLVVPDAMFVVHRARLADLEARYRLPSMHGLPPNVEAGGPHVLRAGHPCHLATRSVFRAPDLERRQLGADQVIQ